MGEVATSPQGCDGASVVILASKDFAMQYTDKLIYVAGVAHKLEASYYAKQLDYGYGATLPTSRGRKDRVHPFRGKMLERVL